jgi:mannonate dehydratase
MAIRIGAFGHLDERDDFLHFLAQHGVEDVILSGKGADGVRRFPQAEGATPGRHWGWMELVHLRTRVEDAGLRLIAIENPVPPWCYDRIMLGQPGRDIQIENLAATIRNMARAGIMMFGYHWMVNPPGVTRASWRTSSTVPARGGARATSYDDEIGRLAPLSRERVYTPEEMWEHYAYFVKAIVPVLEETGVRMALHPDDPPLESLGGIPRLFTGPEGYKRGLALADNSPMSGINLCLGNWTAMGTDIIADIQHFGGRGQIFYGHLQGVQGTVPSFRESFLDDADCDFPAVFEALQAVGFDGPLAPGHFPHTVGDTVLQQQQLAFAIGYTRGILHALDRGTRSPTGRRTPVGAANR